MIIQKSDYLAHVGIMGMKWGKRKKGINYYNKEHSKNSKNNSSEFKKLRRKYDKGLISDSQYTKSHSELIRTHVEKALTDSKIQVLSNMTTFEQKQFKKKTDIGKKQADLMLDKMARGGTMSLVDQLSLWGFK